MMTVADLLSRLVRVEIRTFNDVAGMTTKHEVLSRDSIIGQMTVPDYERVRARSSPSLRSGKRGMILECRCRFRSRSVSSRFGNLERKQWDCIRVPLRDSFGTSRFLQTASVGSGLEPNTNGNQPATKQDIAEVRTELKAMDDRMKAMEDRLIEAFRDSQTELLKAFYSFTESNRQRVSQVEGNQSSLITRVGALEDRMTDLQLRTITPPRTQ
jgi:hypothetical protein